MFGQQSGTVSEMSKRVVAGRHDVYKSSAQIPSPERRPPHVGMGMGMGNAKSNM
jgi:hypothetical protein